MPSVHGPRRENEWFVSFARMPAGVCDQCGRMCWTLHEAGIRCYFCYAGTFVHRKHWEFWWCPRCAGFRPYCDACHDIGFVAVPGENEVEGFEPRE